MLGLVEERGGTMDNSDTSVWEIVCSKDKFDDLKSDDRFLALLTLARFVNALRFCQQAAIDVQNKDAPSGSRQRINSFLFASSVLYEGFRVAENLGKYFRNLDSFKNGFATLLKDKDVRALRETSLERMRNKFVFHFDQDVAKEALNNFELSTYKFATSRGTASGEMYFSLADEAVMNYLLQPKAEEFDHDLQVRLENLIEQITNIMGRFVRATEDLMAEALAGMGWKNREV